MKDDTEFPSLADRVCYQTYALDRAIARAYQLAFGETGLTYPKYVILNALSEGGAMPISSLSARVGVETNSLSPLLKKMADHGGITRTRSAEDERQVLIEITPNGRKILAAAHQSVVSVFNSFGLSEAEAKDLASKLERIRSAVQDADPIKMKMPELD